MISKVLKSKKVLTTKRIFSLTLPINGAGDFKSAITRFFATLRGSLGAQWL